MAEPRKRSFDTYKFRVEKTEILTPANKGLRFRFLEGKTMDFKAGQFMQMFVPNGDKIRRTSYSIASPPKHKDFFELCVTHVQGGTSSTFLHELKIGDEGQAMGPLGKFTLPENNPRSCVFICTGSGIAPFRSMINDLLENKTEKQVFLLFGNRYEPDVIYRQEWLDLAQSHNNFKHFFTLSRADWSGAKGYVQDHIEEFIPDPLSKNFFICGLNKMITQVSDKLESLGVPKAQILYERYD